MKQGPFGGHDPLPDDDWLVEGAGVDWGDPRARGRAPVRPRAPETEESWWGEADASVEQGPAYEDDDEPLSRTEIVRRRRIGAAVAVGLAAAVAVAVAIATTGGGGDTATPTTFTPTTFTPTTPTATTPTGTTPTGTTPTATTPTATTPTATTPTATTPTATTPRATTPTTSTTVTLPDAGKLKAGDTGELVTALQNALATLDLPVGTPDGTFGDATRTAVIQFQTAQGLTPDGIVGPATADKINAVVAAGGTVQTETTTPTTTTPSTTSTTVTLPDAGKLKAGDTGELVTALQNALATLDLPVGTPDGTFGDATRTAVIQFQTAQGLTPDGIVGPATADKINASIPAG